MIVFFYKKLTNLYFIKNLFLIVFIIISKIIFCQREKEIQYSVYFEHDKGELTNTQNVLFYFFNDSILKNEQVDYVDIKGFCNDLGNK